ncbi:Uncharacterised protein [Mycobacteroides abscessus subsp. abscessus]|nr:Uncharacterised protein [Mycobacteroides abscessus subsp. abscessus]
MALVSGASKIEECGSVTMSLETIGSTLYFRMPFSGPSAAALNAALISSTVAFLARSAVRSVIEPVGIGTRSE